MVIRTRLPDVTDSTLTDLRTVGQNSRGRAIRRGTVAVLTVVVIAGALGAFGVRTTSVRASGSGYDLTVTYAAISRAGLDTPWTVRVHRAGGFDGPIVLATTTDYFELFETQGLTPEPDSETTGERYTYQTYPPPPGDTLRIVYDAYVQPAAQHGRPASTALLVDGQEVARVGYRTRLVP